MVVASKQPGPFQPCNLAAKLGEVASFDTYLKFMVKRPNIILKSTARMEYLNSSWPETMNFVTMALALVGKILNIKMPNLLDFVFISTEIVTSLVSPFLQAWEAQTWYKYQYSDPSLAGFKLLSWPP